MLIDEHIVKCRHKEYKEETVIDKNIDMVIRNKMGKTTIKGMVSSKKDSMAEIKKNTLMTDSKNICN